MSVSCAKCSHGRLRDLCSDCPRPKKVKSNKPRPGRRFCKHNREHRNCIQCGGANICPHNRQKYQCKECDGDGICKHGKAKIYCYTCDGRALCEHKHKKYSCGQCHKRVSPKLGTPDLKAPCVGPETCKSGLYCCHKRNHYFCKICGGKGICKHGKYRSGCKECGITMQCMHKRQRHLCVPCGGGGVCEHGSVAYKCVECKGTGICPHNRRKNRCWDCLGYCDHINFVKKCACCWKKRNLTGGPPKGSIRPLLIRLPTTLVQKVLSELRSADIEQWPVSTALAFVDVRETSSLENTSISDIEFDALLAEI